MKKKLMILGVFIITIFLIFNLTTVNATQDENEPMLISNEETENTQVINENVFGFDNNVTESGKIVNGNEFLFSNFVTLESQTINGDLFIFANNVKIKEDVVVNGNVFICASNVEIKAKIEREAYIFAQYLSLGEESEIGYSLYAGAEIIKISGLVNREANLTGNDIQITDTSTISGNLNYSSTKEATISENSVKGVINFDKQVQEDETTGEIIYNYVIELLRNIIFTLFIFLFIFIISPRFINNSKEYISSKILRSIGIGLASLILIPVCSILLIAIGGTASFGLLLIPVYIVMISIAMAIFTIAVASKLSDRFKKIKMPIMIPIVTAIIWLIKQIPYINSIVIFFTLLSGFGILVESIFKKKV